MFGFRENKLKNVALHKNEFKLWEFQHMLKLHIQFTGAVPFYPLTPCTQWNGNESDTHRFRNNYRGLMVRIVKEIDVPYAKTLLNRWSAIWALAAWQIYLNPFTFPNHHTTRCNKFYFPLRWGKSEINLSSNVKEVEGKFFRGDRYTFRNYFNFSFSTLSNWGEMKKQKFLFFKSLIASTKFSWIFQDRLVLIKSSLLRILDKAQ